MTARGRAVDTEMTYVVIISDEAQYVDTNEPHD